MDAEPTDRALLAATGPGAQAHFARVLRRHSGVLYAVAYRQIESVPDAEELVQDAFVLLWRKRARLGLVGDSALPWLIVTVKHLAANRRRANQRRGRHETSAPEVLSAADEPAGEVRDLLDRAFARLPAMDAEIARLCLAEDLSYAEAAERLGLTEGAVRNRLSRARARLRDDLTEGRRDR
ncbi:RNA polymerase sigma factor [Amnibacterium sp. CER49]|uniref:RNA polymerase sigma factor n=1 Tax=Amnibacterium sp. CER49 TaxID=3039161 RepID=UPI0024479927|nr:RNA polymerase sigma factor [Amnibacterium sp. CER49]MDH2444261.1 RNA polymerase sigma factor [Amnibacterium sp. CER49]